MRDPMGLQFIVTMLLLFMVVYFLIMRPQQKQQKARQAMLKNVKKGDRIVTSGGLYGTVVSTKGDDLLIVKLAENVRVPMARPAVASILSPETAKQAGLGGSLDDAEVS